MSLWPLERRRRLRPVWGADAQGLAWHARAGASAVETAEHGAGANQALAAAHGARQIHVIASNALAVHWLQQPPAATRTLAELKLVAAARCAHLYGGMPADWWIAGDWTTRRPFVCSALPRALAEPLQQACEAQGARLRWHSAWSVMCSARSRSFPDYGWSAMRSPQRVLLWHCTGGHVDAITSVATTPEACRAEVRAALEVQIKLESASAMAASPPQVHWADTPECTREATAALALGALLEKAA